MDFIGLLSPVPILWSVPDFIDCILAVTTIVLIRSKTLKKADYLKSNGFRFYITFRLSGLYPMSDIRAMLSGSH